MNWWTKLQFHVPVERQSLFNLFHLNHRVYTCIPSMLLSVWSKQSKAVFEHLSWYIMIYHDLSLSFIIFHYLSIYLWIDQLVSITFCRFECRYFTDPDRCEASQEHKPEPQAAASGHEAAGRVITSCYQMQWEIVRGFRASKCKLVTCFGSWWFMMDNWLMMM